MKNIKTIIWSAATIWCAAVGGMTMAQSLPVRPPSHVTTNLSVHVLSADYATMAGGCVETNTITVNGVTQSISNNPVFTAHVGDYAAFYDVLGAAAGVSNWAVNAFLPLAWATTGTLANAITAVTVTGPQSNAINNANSVASNGLASASAANATGAVLTANLAIVGGVASNAAAAGRIIAINQTSGTIASNNQFYTPANPSDLADYTWTTNNGGITITGCSLAKSGPMTVPAYINGLSVVNIGIGAFDSCDQITSVFIPFGVTNLGNTAFDYMTAVTSVSIPNSVVSIGNSCFSEDINLSDIFIPDSVVTLGNSALNFNNTLTNVYLSSNIKNTYDTFEDCVTLKNITLPTSLTNIGSSTFSTCVQLQSITIPPLVKSIGRNAFVQCNILNAVYYQGNAPSIDSSAFDASPYVTNYILYGKSGWPTPPAVFCGKPTAYYYPDNFGSGRYLTGVNADTAGSATTAATVTGGQSNSIALISDATYGNTNCFYQAQIAKTNLQAAINLCLTNIVVGTSTGTVANGVATVPLGTRGATNVCDSTGANLGTYNSSTRVLTLPTAANMGAATAAQGLLAGTALQPNSVSGTDAAGTVIVNGQVTTVGSAVAASSVAGGSPNFTAVQIGGNACITNISINGTLFTINNGMATGTVATGGGTGTGSASFWTAFTGGVTRIGNTTFVISNNAYTALLAKGVILKWTESSTVRNAFVSIPSVYSAPTCTVTICGDTCASIDSSSMSYCLQDVYAYTPTFAIAGTIGSISTNVSMAYFATCPMRVLGADMQLGTAGTTGSTTLDVWKNGATGLFSGTFPSIASGNTTTATPIAPVSAQSLALGDKVTINVTAVNTTPAVDVYMQLYVMPTALDSRQ